MKKEFCDKCGRERLPENDWAEWPKIVVDTPPFATMEMSVKIDSTHNDFPSLWFCKWCDLDAIFETRTSYYSPKWISVKDALPDRCANVIVLGFIEKVNVCRQAWNARLWGKCNDGSLMWITPCDTPVNHVSHWMPLPKERAKLGFAT